MLLVGKNARAISHTSTSKLVRLVKLVTEQRSYSSSSSFIITTVGRLWRQRLTSLRRAMVGISSDDGGGITVMNAATLVCLRLRPRSSGDQSETWEVLLGQSEVKNWLRSSESVTRVMRYPGEWKFPGGVVDDCDASLLATALRELEEEFLGLPASARDAKTHFLSEKITKAIQRRRHRMFNFVAFEDENTSWMSDAAIAHVNATLAAKRAAFEATHLADGSFWRMTSGDEKMRVSPEIHRVQWFPIDAAMEMMRGALIAPHTPVDAWQQREFTRYGVTKRDPMYITYRVLLDIAEVVPPRALKDHVRANVAPSIEHVRMLSSAL